MARGRGAARTGALRGQGQEVQGARVRGNRTWNWGRLGLSLAQLHKEGSWGIVSAPGNKKTYGEHPSRWGWRGGEGPVYRDGQ